MKRYPWFVLAVLLTVYMVHHLDRQVVTLLLEPIGKEFNLSDSQLGLLAGTVYAISFCLAGIPIGLLIDRVNRVRLLSGLITIWSGLTAICAWASNFGTLVLMRIGIGAAESGATPTNLSLVYDYFDQRRRSTAVGIYFMGPHLGTIVGFALAAIIAAHYGWRAAFLAAGLPGLLLAALVFWTVKEPPRGTTEPGDARAQPAPPLKQTLRLIWSDSALVHVIIGLTIANSVAAGISIWLPTLLMRVHGASIQTAGLSVALCVSTFSALASLGSGMYSDKLGARGPSDITRFAAFAAVLAVPLIVYGVMTQYYWLTIAAFAIKGVAHMMISTPITALALSLTSPAIRGSTAAVLQVLSTLFGYGVGPQVVGFISDLLSEFGAQSLRYALAIFVFVYLWATGHLLYAGRLLRAPERTRALTANAAMAQAGADGSGHR